MLKKAYSIWKRYGVVGLVRAVLRRCGISVLSDSGGLTCYREFRRYFLGRVGLEIGGPSNVFRSNAILPVYVDANRIDNCNFACRTVWEAQIQEGLTFRYDEQHSPGNQYIREAAKLEGIPSSTYDFVLSSHTLEHVANPLLALSEWIRVLKPRGVLLLVVPHRDGTFDHRRPVTTLAHLVEDLERNTPENDLTHLEEILRLHDLSMDLPAGDIESFRQRSLKNPENRCLHHHVFDTRLAVEMVHHAGLQILAVEPTPPFHIVLLAQRRRWRSLIDNEPFRGRNGPPVWASTFPSDLQPQPVAELVSGA